MCFWLLLYVVRGVRVRTALEQMLWGKKVGFAQISKFSVCCVGCDIIWALGKLSHGEERQQVKAETNFTGGDKNCWPSRGGGGGGTCRLWRSARAVGSKLDFVTVWASSVDRVGGLGREEQL